MHNKKVDIFFLWWHHTFFCYMASMAKILWIFAFSILWNIRHIQMQVFYMIIERPASGGISRYIEDHFHGKNQCNYAPLQVKYTTSKPRIHIICIYFIIVAAALYSYQYFAKHIHVYWHKKNHIDLFVVHKGPSLRAGNQKE